MSLIRMDIHTLVVTIGPVSSLLVLETRVSDGEVPMQLPIRIGSYEASAISMGIEQSTHERPMTHDLIKSMIESLGATLSGVSIVDVHGTTFYAVLMLSTSDGRSIELDCRPSDAIALAVRVGVPIYAEESVITAAALPDFRSVERDEKDREMERFHDFVESISPEDFID